MVKMQIESKGMIFARSYLIIIMIYGLFNVKPWGPYSLSGKTACRQISRNLEAARLDVIMTVSL